MMKPYIKQLKSMNHYGLEKRLHNKNNVNFPKLLVENHAGLQINLSVMEVEKIYVSGNFTCSVSKAILRGSNNSNGNIVEPTVVYINRQSFILQEPS